MVRMITEIKEISFDESKMKWFLWYDDIIGGISHLEFQKKNDAGFFSMGFNWLKDSLKIKEDKLYFYEGTELTPKIIDSIITLGRTRKAIQSIIDNGINGIKEKVKLYLRDEISFDLDNTPILRFKRKND